VLIEHSQGIVQLLERIFQQVGDQQQQVCPADQVEQLRLQVHAVGGRGIDQLHLDIFHLHHAWGGLPGGVQGGGDLRLCVGQGGDQGGLAGVGWADHHHLTGALPLDVE